MNFKVIVEDPILLKVLAKYYERSQLGIKKYGRTLDRDDLSFIDWLNHLQEELMDATLYIEKLKKEAQKKSIIELMNMDSYDKPEQTEDALKLVLNYIKNTPEDVFNNQLESIKKTRSKKGCACYGSNEIHECNCK